MVLSLGVGGKQSRFGSPSPAAHCWPWVCCRYERSRGGKPQAPASAVQGHQGWEHLLALKALEKHVL